MDGQAVVLTAIDTAVDIWTVAAGQASGRAVPLLTHLQPQRAMCWLPLGGDCRDGGRIIDLRHHRRRATRSDPDQRMCRVQGWMCVLTAHLIGGWVNLWQLALEA
eukprot:6199770-Pleurochrysis_carterae.AAC.2